ncbi:MAG: glycine--tRNA ligase subunit beta, partial [Sandaracinaceae bacterium]|nr:glycine--tRNA ligase subunit beta [Sandaracinaceae bacterium]
MSTLLLEIGVEELPASFVRNALAAMPELARKLFESERLSHGAIRALGTPRRLALLVEDLAERQTDLSEQVLGPPKAAAFDESGKPKKAAEGFAKKLGVPVEALALVATDKGEYVAAQRDEKGKPAAEVLAAGIARLITQIPFAKSMRWGTSELAFGRPIHWIVALHGERVVDVEIAGARAGRSTRGHRFLAPASFELARAEGYVEALRAAHVLVDPDERTARMNDALAAAATQAGGVLVEDAFLVGENASLVEEPHVIAGSFDAAYLSLPDSVIVEVMKGHQRYFALRDRQGKLLPRYLAVVNTALAPDVVVRGNDRVLRARLADARFFVDEDRKHTLASRLDKLAGVVFQAKLGSVRERVE